MAFAVSQGQLRSVDLPLAAAPTALRLSSDFSQDYAGIFRSQRAVNTAVTAIARQLGQIGLHCFARVSDTDRERVLDTDLARLLSAPAPGVSPYAFKYALAADLAIFARYIAVKSEHPDGSPALVRLPPLDVELIGGSWAGPEAFKVGRMVIPASKVVFIRGYSPNASHSGVSPLESLRQTLAEDYEAGQMREQQYRNGSRVTGYLERPAAAQKWSDQARSNFRESWRRQYSGSGGQVGGTPILEDGMTFKPASMTSKDLQYIEARKLTREEVAAAFHIPPTMVGVLDHATFGNIREQHQMLYQDTLGPWLVEIQQELLLQVSEWLAVPDGHYIEFNIAEKLRGSFEDQAQQLQAATGGPYMTRAEARARLNLPRIEGADELIMPLNLGTSVGAGIALDDEEPELAKAAPRPLAKSAQPKRDEKVADVVSAFFARQRAVVKSKLGAKAAQPWWDEQRWNEELAADLLPQTIAASSSQARRTLRALGVDPNEYDVEQTRTYLANGAADSAASINAATRIQIEEALADDEDPLAAVDRVFEVAEESRAAQIAGVVVAAAIGFAQIEAVEQVSNGRDAYKEWITGPNPRPTHAAMNGERVAIDDVFSNGARWPGWGGIDVDETAGCNCQMVIGWND